MQNPLISILLPFKNTQDFIEECIVSILNQTYANWELIIVDDGSTDTSYNIVNDFAKIDNRIMLLKNTGSGIIDALRFAFKHCNGELITRMDSDDIMLTNKLEVLADNLLEFGKGHIATGMVEYFSEHGIGKGYKEYESWLNSLTKTGNNFSEIYKECVIPSPCWMVYKSDLIACDAFNPKTYPEDYDLAFRFYKHQLKCIPCDTVLHNWRDYSTRTSRTHKSYAENHFLDLKLKYFLELDYNPKKTLVVWGAGKKGKIVAKKLVERKVTFKWICNNPNKIGRDIYGKILHSFNYLENIKNQQSIITVANKKSQEEIKEYFAKLNMQLTQDYIFFC